SDAPNWRIKWEKTMHDAPQQHTTHDANDPGALVDTYLITLMKPDPEGARQYVSPELRIRFTGGREMRDPSECTAFNKARYAWVKKRFESTDVVAGATDEYAVVYNR